MIITDELAEALQELVNALNGYKNCPSIQGMTTDAMSALAKSRQANDSNLSKPWFIVQRDHPDIWQEWLHVGAKIFGIYLQERHPDVWKKTNLKISKKA